MRTLTAPRKRGEVVPDLEYCCMADSKWAWVRRAQGGSICGLRQTGTGQWRSWLDEGTISVQQQPRVSVVNGVLWELFTCVTIGSGGGPDLKGLSRMGL